MIAMKTQRPTPKLVWLPLRDIVAMQIAFHRKPEYPYDHKSPTAAHKQAWSDAFAIAEQIVVAGLPWSEIAFDATVYRLFKESTKNLKEN